MTHILRVESFALAVTGEAASDGAVAVGFNLNFSLDARHGFTISRRQLAEGGMVHATVFQDLNDNGVHDKGEPFEKGALVTTGATQTERKTDAKGSVTVGGLTPYVAIPVSVNATEMYSSAQTISVMIMPNGKSRCGLLHSSAAVDTESKPI